MKNLIDCLNANKISLNVQKTELVIFKHESQKEVSKVKIKLNRKRLCPTDTVKYLYIRIDKNLNCKHHVSDIAIKLNRENALPFNLNFVNLNNAIFDSHIDYANVIWVQNFSAVNRVYL